MEINERGLYNAFYSPYRGIAADGFVEHLEHNDRAFHNPHNKYYAKFCPIVQSSGTGKSRMMFELGKKGVVVLFINIREPRNRVSYPLRDDVPADLLRPWGEGSDERCCAFFAAVFKTILSVLSTCLDETDRDIARAIQLWDNLMCDLHSRYRDRFFGQLKDEYNKVLRETTKQGDASQASLRQAHQQMIESLPELFQNGDVHKPKLVIAFDEAHTLNPINSDRWKPWLTLARTINCYSRKSAPDKDSGEAVWVVFISTTTVAHDISPLSKKENWLFPPYSLLGWDQYADPFRKVPANKVARFDHIAGFGRPLWKSLKDAGYYPWDVKSLAFYKIRGGEMSGLSRKGAISLLAQRLSFDIAIGTSGSHEFVQTTAASYLRVRLETTMDLSWTFSTYPSEPLVSCIAARILNSPDLFNEILSHLDYEIRSGLVDVGHPGELASRLLWLIAKDLFVRTLPHASSFWVDEGKCEDYWKSEITDCAMVPLHGFLAFLFGDDFWAHAGPACEVAFQDAYINFSHWIRMEEPVFIDPECPDEIDFQDWTGRHWYRTCAVQCSHDQPLIDKAIPIYFKEKDQFSEIFISDRVRDKPSEEDLKDPWFAKHSTLPFVAILADMGVEFEKDAVDTPRVTASFEDSCLRIHAIGLDKKTYPFLPKRSYALDDVLRHLVRWHKDRSVPLFQAIGEKTKWGSTAAMRHMLWEEWPDTTTVQG